MKKVVKNTKKSNKPELFVDFTDLSSVNKVHRAFGIAKINAGMAINKAEIDAIIDCAVDDFINYLFSWNNAIMKNDAGKFIRLNLGLYEADKVNTTIADAGIKPKKAGFFKRVMKKIFKK